MIDPTDVHSMTDFRRNTAAHVRRLKRTGKPEVLTTKGRATVVIQDAGAYESQMRQLEQHRLERVLLEGLASDTSSIQSPAALKKHLRAHLSATDKR